MSMPETLLTPQGMQKLKEELDELINNRRPAIIKRIATARELGDLKENADYHDARNEQSFIESKIRQIEARIRTARIIEASDASVAGIGTSVTVVNESTGDTETWHLTGTAEADPLAGKVSHESPIGSALMGAKVDDVVAVNVPKGQQKLKIVSIAVT